MSFLPLSLQCSEDEEDDLLRKEEVRDCLSITINYTVYALCLQLRQLLSEQLHDDLLDDSIATSVDGEISLVSSLRYSLSPSERVSERERVG